MFIATPNPEIIQQVTSNYLSNLSQLSETGNGL